MIPSEHCVALIKEFEGLATKAYKCPAGVLTIGYGHTKNVKEGDTITERAANNLLKNDLKAFSIRLVKALNADEIEVTQDQFDALCSFAFNVGITALIYSTLWKLLKDNKDKQAADEFLKWNKITIDGRKVELKGLTRRREAERKLFLNGTSWDA